MNDKNRFRDSSLINRLRNGNSNGNKIEVKENSIIKGNIEVQEQARQNINTHIEGETKTEVTQNGTVKRKAQISGGKLVENEQEIEVPSEENGADEEENLEETTSNETQQLVMPNTSEQNQNNPLENANYRQQNQQPNQQESQSNGDKTNDDNLSKNSNEKENNPKDTNQNEEPTKKENNEDNVPEKLKNRGDNNPSKKAPPNPFKKNPGANNRKTAVENKSESQKSNENKNTSDETSGNSVEDTENNDGIKERVAKLKKTISTILIAFFALIVLFVIMTVVVTVVTIMSNGQLDISISSYEEFTDPTINQESYYYNKEANPEAYEKELKFYKTLDEKTKYSSGSCQINLNSTYVSTVLKYRYYYLEDSFDSVDFTEYEFDKMEDKIDDIVDLMVDKDTCTVDYNIGGKFFTRLKDSNFFKDYYKKPLESPEYNHDTYKLLEEIFDACNDVEVNTGDTANSLFISPSLQVNISTSSTFTTNKIVPLTEYIAGSIYANVDNSIIESKNKEELKSYTAIYTTNLLATSDYKSNDTIINIQNNNNGVLYCSLDKGCSRSSNGTNSFLQDGGTTSTKGGDVFYDNQYYYKEPLSEEDQKYLNSIVEETFGDVLLKDNKVEKITNTTLDNTKGDYKEILKNNLPGYKITNISEDNYTSGITYPKNYHLIEVKYYSQKDYKQAFCGRTKIRKCDIKECGCGTTAMAMVLSTFVDDSYDPVKTMNLASKGGYCGVNISGTSTGFFCNQARKNGLGCSAYGKNNTAYKKVISALSGKQEALVIALMGPGTFTTGGHYIVLAGYDGSNKKVYVYDPYNKNKNQKWYSFNNIVAKQAKNFFIITKG